MKNKGLLLIAGGIAIAAAIIAWLMFGGEAPKNPENTASNAVSAVVKNTTVSREQDGRRLWEFSVEALESISGSGDCRRNQLEPEGRYYYGHRQSKGC